jgi:hypothetical protein
MGHMRDRRIVIRLTAEEFAAVQREAKKAKRTWADWIRLAIADAVERLKRK